MSPPPTGPRRADPLPAPAPDARADRDTDDAGDLTSPVRPARPDQAGRGGLGSSPPDVAFSVGGGPATEDGFITFTRDSAALGPGARATLEALVASQVGGARDPVTVTVHGYASGEGDATYNVNLSAHRATAVQRALTPLLPPGSEIRLVAHGATDAFGDNAAVNRRAGIDVEPRRSVPFAQQAPPGGPTPSVEVGDDGAGNPVSVDPDAPAPASAAGPALFPPLPRLTLTPGLLEPRPDDLARWLPHGWWQQPPSPALSLLDHEGVYAGLRLRGIAVDERWAAGVEAHYQFWFWRLHRDLGLREGWAAWLANVGTGVWVDTEAAAQRPTPFDEFNRQRDIDHKLQGAWKTPVVPLHPTIRFDLTDLFRKGK